MEFKNVKTYGKTMGSYRNRIIKINAWISPESDKSQQFSSSDSAHSTELENEIHSAEFPLPRSSPSSSVLGRDDHDVSCFTSLRDTVQDDEKVCAQRNRDGTDSSHAPRKNSSFASLKSTQRESPLILEHSTPLTGLVLAGNVYSQGLKAFTPPSVSATFRNRQCNLSGSIQREIKHDTFGSPILFSDTGSGCDTECTVSLSCNESKEVADCSQNKCKGEHISNLKCTDLEQCSQNSQTTSVLSLSNKMKEFSMLDGKVYLDSSEGLRLPNNVTKDSRLLKSNTSGKRMKSPTQISVNSEKLENGNESCSSFSEALTPLTRQRKKAGDARRRILDHCGQQRPLKFTDILSPSEMADCVKVAEGTYAEVYRAKNGDEDVALKIIPCEGSFTVNGEPQKSFEDMIPEIVISNELSNLADVDAPENACNLCPNFIQVKRVVLVQDGYPEVFLRRWDEWNSDRKSENDRPDIFPSSQYFVVFEFVDGGTDLERFEFHEMEEALCALQQVLLSLAVSEHSLMFEHRDLHWGNVLIKRSDCQTLHYKLNGEDIFLQNCDVFVSIIDFTFSRLTKDGVTVFCNLSKDPEIFTGKGDYQFEVYRLMRKANKDDWEAHVPYTNVLWVRYLVDKVLNVKQYRTKNTALQRHLRTIFRRLLSYDGTVTAVRNGFFNLQISSLSN